MKKRRIVIASILKPVDDTRMLEKMGMSLDRTGSFEVFIVGYPSTQPPAEGKNIHFLPLGHFPRISIQRLLAPWNVLQKIIQVKPQLLIVNTHELLIVALLNRILFGTHIIYDVRENYWRNILNTHSFPSILRPLLSGWVRLKEKCLAPFFQAFFLAEEGYSHEMKFFRKRFVVIENKSIIPPGFQRKKNHECLQLLFSGTLDESTGVFHAIELAKRLYDLNPSVRLQIVGYAALAETRKRLRSETAPFITMEGVDELVPHSRILEAIAESDFGIISYPQASHTDNSIPTKLYEYLSLCLPILLQDKPQWVSLCASVHAAISMDFKHYNPVLLLREMQSNSFYTKPSLDMTWASEEVKLLRALDRL